MPRTAAEYREQLKALLPPGIAFPREPGTRLEELLDGMAQELARIDARGERLIIEANPLSTSELLADWERVADLPDNCTGTFETTLQGRRNALISKLTATGGQSPAYFIEVARALGYEVNISEFRPFRAGVSAAGEPLRTWGNDTLECKIDQLKPAHTIVLYGYGAIEIQQAYLLSDRLWHYANFILPEDIVG